MSMTATNEVQEVTVPAQWVLGMRKRGKYAEIAPMIMGIAMYAMERGIALVGPPAFVMHECCAEEAMQADKEGAADLEIAFPVGGRVEGRGEIRCYELPGGRMATIMHKGPYMGCESTYRKLYAWFEERGKSIAGPVREVYLNDPREVGESEALTQIFAPVE